jgi:hypothetical protein
MAATMAVTQADIDNLTRAIASGERQVSIGGQQITYRSISDLKDARRTLQDELDLQNGVTRNRQYRLYQSGRGY